MIHNSLGKSGRCDAIGQYAARFGFSFKNGNFVACLGQLCCASQGCRASAYTGDLAGLLFLRCFQRLHLEELLLLDCVSLQFADLDRSVDSASGASLFTEIVIRANSGAAASQDISASDGLSRALHISEPDRPDKFRRIRSCGAAFAARCIVAQKASRCFFHSGSVSEARYSLRSVFSFCNFTQFTSSFFLVRDNALKSVEITLFS